MQDGNVEDFLYRRANHSDQFLKSLNGMRQDGHYTDFTLLADGNSIPCHKVVLAAQIPYFHSMFSRYVQQLLFTIFEVIIMMLQICLNGSGNSYF